MVANLVANLLACTHEFLQSSTKAQSQSAMNGLAQAQSASWS
jgi:hypothetical protein